MRRDVFRRAAVGLLLCGGGGAVGQEAGPRPDDDAPDEAGLPVAPAPDAPGGWGAMWETTPEGGISPTLRIYPFHPTALHDLEVRINLGGGREVAWSAGPFVSDGDAPIRYDVVLPDDVDATLAGVNIIVSAHHPVTGALVGAHQAHAWAWRDPAGQVGLHTLAEGQARALVRDDGDGLVEEIMPGAVVQ